MLDNNTIITMHIFHAGNYRHGAFNLSLKLRSHPSSGRESANKDLIDPWRK